MIIYYLFQAMSELAPLVKGRYTANFDALHHTSAPAPANRKVEETEADGVERMEKMEKMVAEFWVKRFAATSSSSPPAAAALLIAQLRDALGVLAAIDGCVGKWVETTKKPSSPRGVVKHAGTYRDFFLKIFL
jgi:hypothetical protein